MSVLEDIAAALSTDGLDEAAGAEAGTLGLHFLDTIGAWIVGRETSDSRALDRIHDGADGESTTPALPLEIISRASAAIRLTEIDDIHLPSCTTPGAVVYPIVVVLAANNPAIDHVRARRAALAGYRAMAGLGAAIRGPEVLYRGIWPSYFAAPFAAAATTSVLFGLDQRMSANALSIALTMAVGGVGRTTAIRASRWLLLGEAARLGCTAALAARAGVTSDLALLDGAWLANAHGIDPDLARLKDWINRGDAAAATSYKPWCSAKQAIAATHAFARLTATHIDPKQAREIRIEVPPAYAAMIGGQPQDGARLAALSSAAYRIALAACDRDGLYDILADGARPSSALNEFMNRVTVTAAPDLSAHYPHAWPARVTIITASGAATETVVTAPGDPGSGFGVAEVARKFQRFAGPRLGPAAADWTALIGTAFDGRAEFSRAISTLAPLCRSPATKRG